MMLSSDIMPSWLNVRPYSAPVDRQLGVKRDLVLAVRGDRAR